jgi:hypothetical protein
MIADNRRNPLRYSYPGKFFVNSADVGRFRRFGKANNKGEWYLHLSLPLIFNSFVMKPENEEVKMNRDWEGARGGITFGFDYFHSRNQFVHFGVSYVGGGNQFNDSIGKRETVTTAYFSFSNNHKIERFSIGYGFSFARNTWTTYRRFFGRYDVMPKNHNTFGLMFPAYFQLWEHLNIGVVYRPTFYRPNLTERFLYEHLISIDLAWKVRIRK